MFIKNGAASHPKKNERRHRPTLIFCGKIELMKQIIHEIISSMLLLLISTSFTTKRTANFMAFLCT